MAIRPVKVLRTRDLGPQFVNNPHRMVGQDGAFSFPLRDGSSFWYFGDTLIGARPKECSPWMIDGKMVDHRDMTGQGPYEQMINNTGLILPKQSGASGLRDFKYITNPDGRLKNLLPLEGDEHADWDRIWCQGGIALDDRIVLSFIQVKMVEKYSGPLPIGFEIVGSGIAHGARDGTEWEFERVRRDGSHLLWDWNDPHFGVAFLHDKKSDVVYAYGTVNEKAGHQSYLAATCAPLIHSIESYRYFAGGNKWSESDSEAVPLFGGMPSEMSVSFNEHLNCYLAVHSLDLTGQIVARTAPNPWGPWSEPTVLYQVQPAALNYELPYPFRLIYAGKEHPQLSPDSGKTIYLTYIEFEEYFPHLIEVELA